MPQPDLLSEGFGLMLFGMGFVFLFLTLLVGVTRGMSLLVQHWTPEPAPQPIYPSRSVSANPTAQDPELIAAISAAITQHRQQKQKPSKRSE